MASTFRVGQMYRIFAGEPAEAISWSWGPSAATINRHYFVANDAVDVGHRLPSLDDQLIEVAGGVPTSGTRSAHSLARLDAAHHLSRDAALPARRPDIG